MKMLDDRIEITSLGDETHTFIPSTVNDEPRCRNCAYHESYYDTGKNIHTIHCSIGMDPFSHCNKFVERYKPGHTYPMPDPVNAPNHYTGKIECIDYLREKLTKEEFTGFCVGNVLKYVSRWRKKDGLQDLKKASVYLNWAIQNEDSSFDIEEDSGK